MKAVTDISRYVRNGSWNSFNQ